MSVQEQVTDELIVGANPMAAELNQPLRRVQYWLQTGRIQSARKLGDMWVVSRSALRREFGLV
jgi:hypothetical protein